MKITLPHISSSTHVKRRYPILWRHCDVNTARKKNVNIFFLKLHIFLWLKIDKNHFYQKLHTGAQHSTQGPTLIIEKRLSKSRKLLGDLLWYFHVCVQAWTIFFFFFFLGGGGGGGSVKIMNFKIFGGGWGGGGAEKWIFFGVWRFCGFGVNANLDYIWGLFLCKLAYFLRSRYRTRTFLGGY